MKDIIPSFPPVTEHICAGSVLAISASGLFGELILRRDEGYVSLIPTGHRTSLYGPAITNNSSVRFGELKGIWDVG
jgi:hypothetical protein